MRLRTSTEDRVPTVAQRPRNGMVRLVGEVSSSDPLSDLRRAVFGILGVPFDALDFPTVLAAVVSAVNAGKPFLIESAARIGQREPNTGKAAAPLVREDRDAR